MQKRSNRNVTNGNAVKSDKTTDGTNPSTGQDKSGDDGKGSEVVEITRLPMFSSIGKQPINGHKCFFSEVTFRRVMGPEPSFEEKLLAQLSKVESNISKKKAKKIHRDQPQREEDYEVATNAQVKKCKNASTDGTASKQRDWSELAKVWSAQADTASGENKRRKHQTPHDHSTVMFSAPEHFDSGYDSFYHANHSSLKERPEMSNTCSGEEEEPTTHTKEGNNVSVKKICTAQNEEPNIEGTVALTMKCNSTSETEGLRETADDTSGAKCSLASPSKQQDLSSSPSRQQASISSPSREYELSVSPSRTPKAISSPSGPLDSISSPSRQQDSTSSPSSQQDSISSPSGQQDSISSLSRQQDSTSSPSRQQDTISSLSIQDSISSPSRQQDSTSSPSRQQDSISSPSRQQDSISSLSRQQDSTSSPSRLQDSTSSPSGQQDSISSLSRQQDSTSSPNRLQDSTSSPSRQDSISSPTRQQDSISSPSGQQDSISSPSRLQDSTSSPSRQQDSISSLSRQQDSTSSPSRQQDSISSPSRQQDSISSPSRQQDSISSPSRQQDTISSPSRQQDSISSPSRQQDAISSPSRQQDSISSPSKQYESSISPIKPHESTDKLLSPIGRPAAAISNDEELCLVMPSLSSDEEEQVEDFDGFSNMFMKVPSREQTSTTESGENCATQEIHGSLHSKPTFSENICTPSSPTGDTIPTANIMNPGLSVIVPDSDVTKVDQRKLSTVPAIPAERSDADIPIFSVKMDTEADSSLQSHSSSVKHRKNNIWSMDATPNDSSLESKSKVEQVKKPSKFKVSNLTAKEHNQYLSLFKKYVQPYMSGNRAPVFTQKQRTDLETFERLQRQVLDEQKEFQNYLQESANRNQKAYAFLKTNAAQYSQARCKCYHLDKNHIYEYSPAVVLQVPLHHGDDGHLEVTDPQIVLEVGKPPRVSLPDLQDGKKPGLILNDKNLELKFPMCPLNKQAGYITHETVSCDGNAATLARKYDADVVMSSSVVKCLLDNHAPQFERCWNIPFHVVTTQPRGKDQKEKKVVYMDKPLSNAGMSRRELNTLFHKYAFRSLITQPCKQRHRRGKVSQDVPSFTSQSDVYQVDHIFDLVSSEQDSLETFGMGIRPKQNQKEIVSEVPIQKKSQQKSKKRMISVQRNDIDSEDGQNLYSQSRSEHVSAASGDCVSTGKLCNSEILTQEMQNDSVLMRRQSVQSCAAETNPLDGVMINDQYVDSLTLPLKVDVNIEQRTNEHLQGDRRQTRSGSISSSDAKANSQVGEVIDEVPVVKKAKFSDHSPDIKDALLEPDVSASETRQHSRPPKPHSVVNRTLRSSSKISPSPPGKELRIDGTRQVKKDSPFHDGGMQENVMNIKDKTCGKVVPVLISDSPSSPDMTSPLSPTASVSGHDDHTPASPTGEEWTPQVGVREIPTSPSHQTPDVCIIPLSPSSSTEKFPEEPVNVMSSKRAKRESKEHQFVSPLDSILGAFTGREVKSKQENPSHYFPPAENTYSLLYSLWLVGSHRILVRCNHHGVLLQAARKKNQSVYVTSKMEYQYQHGFEQVTLSESTRNWASCLVRPNTSLLRARINAFTSEIVKLEETELSGILRPSLPFQPQKGFAALNNILSHLCSLEEGRYLLTHQPGQDHCSVLFRTGAHRHAWTDAKVTDLVCSLEDPVPWIPIDPSMLLASHVQHNRIPATFFPKDFVKPAHWENRKGTGNTEVNSGKKKNKKKKGKWKATG